MSEVCLANERTEEPDFLVQETWLKSPYALQYIVEIKFLNKKLLERGQEEVISEVNVIVLLNLKDILGINKK